VTSAKYRNEAAFLAQELLAQMWTDNGNIAVYAFLERSASRENPTLGHQGAIAASGRGKPASDRDPDQSQPGCARGATGATVQITVRWRLPDEVDTGTSAHSHTVVAYVYPSST